MEAPQSPVDIKVVLGNETGCQNLLNIDIDFSDEKDNVWDILCRSKIYWMRRKLPLTSERMGFLFSICLWRLARKNRHSIILKYNQMEQKGQKGQVDHPYKFCSVTDQAKTTNLLSSTYNNMKDSSESPIVSSWTPKTTKFKKQTKCYNVLWTITSACNLTSTLT